MMEAYRSLSSFVQCRGLSPTITSSRIECRLLSIMVVGFVNGRIMTSRQFSVLDEFAFFSRHFHGADIETFSSVVAESLQDGTLRAEIHIQAGAVFLTSELCGSRGEEPNPLEMENKAIFGIITAAISLGMR
jgi:hypothetical protein